MSGHDAFLDEIEQRVVAALGLRLMSHGGRAPNESAPLGEFLRSIAAPCRELIARQGWETRPSFPGRSLGVQTGGGTPRIACASELWSGNEKIGVVFTTVIAGREPIISVGPPQARIPETWTTSF